MTHTIYHIPGHKVGCTIDFERRKKEYPKDTQFEILIDSIEGLSDQEAGDIEWAYADMYGYHKGWHFAVSMENAKKGALAASYVIKNMPSEKLSERAFKAAQSQTAEERSAKALKMIATLGPEGVLNRVKKSMATMGPEGLSKKNKKTASTLGPEGLRLRALKGAETRRLRGDFNKENENGR